MRTHLPNSLERTIVVALTTIVLSFGCGCVETRPSEPSTEVMHSLVDGYAQAIETNNRELALWYIHPRSPFRSELDAALQDQLAAYQEKARTMRLELVQQQVGSAAAVVDQELVRIFGLKLSHAKRRSNYQFRTLGDSWRIWRIDSTDLVRP